MAGIVSILFKKQVATKIIRTVGDSNSPMLLDATVKENFSAAAEPTQHPVEAGADITDHVILKPKALTVSGIITEIPFPSSIGGALGSLTRLAGATVGATIGKSLGKFGKAAGIGGGIGGALLGGAIGKSLAGAIFGSDERTLGTIAAEFVKIRDARAPVDIQTGLQLYKNYILSSFTITRDQKSGNSFAVDLEFKELILAESQTTTIAIPKLASALKKTNKGRQTAANLSGDKEKRGASILKKLVGGIG